MKKRILSFILVALFSVNFLSLGVSAKENSPSAITIERVHHEVLSGNITNQQDVILVALAEYAQSQTSTAMKARKNVSHSDDFLMISQVLACHVDPNTGCEYKSVAVTSLLIVDEKGNQVTRAEIEDSYTEGDYTSFGNYQVYATHTAYLDRRMDNLGELVPDVEVRLSKMETRINYGSSVTVSTTLQHTYRFVESGQIPTVYSESQVIYNPSNNHPYSFTPPSSPWLIMDGPDSYFTTCGIITCNGERKEVSCCIKAF